MLLCWAAHTVMRAPCATPALNLPRCEGYSNPRSVAARRSPACAGNPRNLAALRWARAAQAQPKPTRLRGLPRAGNPRSLALCPRAQSPGARVSRPGVPRAHPLASRPGVRGLLTPVTLATARAKPSPALARSRGCARAGNPRAMARARPRRARVRGLPPAAVTLATGLGAGAEGLRGSLLPVTLAPGLGCPQARGVRGLRCNLRARALAPTGARVIVRE
jgi:hypothetical protein